MDASIPLTHTHTLDSPVSIHPSPPLLTTTTNNHPQRLHRFLRLSFLSVSDLMNVRAVLLPLVEKNKQRAEVQLATGGGLGAGGGMMEGARPPDDFFETLVDMREYDVPYVVRGAIDQDLRVGAWYTVSARGDGVTIKWEKDMIEKVCCFGVAWRGVACLCVLWGLTRVCI